MAYDPADYTYEDWLMDTEDGIDRCVHGVDVDQVCEDCSPENVPADYPPPGGWLAFWQSRVRGQ